MGCQKRCHFCKSKCCLSNAEHENCETKFHFLNGYSGTSQQITNKILFEKCTSKQNLDCGWHSGDKKFENGFALLKAKAPNWIDSINVAYANGSQDYISEKEKKCAVAIKEILLKKYDLKDNEEYNEWENLLSADKKLHVPITIDGYLSVK